MRRYDGATAQPFLKGWEAITRLKPAASERVAKLVHVEPGYTAWVRTRVLNCPREAKGTSLPTRLRSSLSMLDESGTRRIFPDFG